MIEILGSAISGGLLGGILRLAPEIFKFFNAKGEREHELSMFKAQVELEKWKGEQKLAEIGAEHQMKIDSGVMSSLAAAIESQTEMAKAAGGWVASFSASIRPGVSTFVYGLYGVVKIVGITAACIQEPSVIDAIRASWDADDMALLAGITNYWFLNRTLEKRQIA